MRHSIDDTFINQLFSHPSFQLRLRQTQKHQSFSRVEAPQIVELAEEIGTLLAAEYKQRVEQQCYSIYQSHLQLMKEVQQLKHALIYSPNKTAPSPIKEPLSILSEVELEQESDTIKNRKMTQEFRVGKGNISFMSSFLCESEIRQKQELEERINASIINLSGDVAKFESSVEERLKNVENSLTRKIENIYKTLTSVFEITNDLQYKFNNIQKGQDTKQSKDQKETKQEKQKVQKRKVLEKAIDLSLTQKANNQKPAVQRESENGGGRRRSFLGFLKY